MFQSPCLLPWLTAREATCKLARRSRGRRSASRTGQADAERYLDLVGVGDAADQLPAALSLGTQQCVSLARALSLEPRFLLLDEPFSQLDSLTRFELQDTLLRVWEKQRRIVVMVTHDVDEALYLADRLILMTDGPEAGVGEILQVPFPTAAAPCGRSRPSRVLRVPPAHHGFPRPPRPAITNLGNRRCAARPPISARTLKNRTGTRNLNSEPEPEPDPL